MASCGSLPWRAARGSRTATWHGDLLFRIVKKTTDEQRCGCECGRGGCECGLAIVGQTDHWRRGGGQAYLRAAVVVVNPTCPVKPRVGLMLMAVKACLLLKAAVVARPRRCPAACGKGARMWAGMWARVWESGGPGFRSPQLDPVGAFDKSFLVMISQRPWARPRCVW